MSREDLSALLGAGSVIKTVQQQSNARAVARALEHDLNGILYVFLLFVLRKRDREDGDGEENKGARDCSWNPLRALMKQEAS